MIFRYFRAVALLCILCFCTSLHAQDATTLRVQILNGKTGRPVTNAHLKLFRDAHLAAFNGARDNKGETTDGEGYASIPNVDIGVSSVLIAVDLYRPCSKTGKHDFSLLKVRTPGVVSDNSCRTRISLYPQPGTLIFFVRPETLLEKMRR